MLDAQVEQVDAADDKGEEVMADNAEEIVNTSFEQLVVEK